ncbi:hypothetical protein M5X11_33530 [Paenibacillus alginolyticus]|uniref:hypothetical protein n=1 Tax=Paenibacillus alginolyticus TaxID=59839 RepID=UPI00049272DF|nr:hypothetical protein [Paenibacillus alginolyticus]MCY9669777.1 hypothetical protein [Paenibacillus alginolyticus]
MSFYTEATALALKNPKTIVDIELMYERCLTYAPGTNEHRVLLYEDGSTFYHRIFIGSTELADVRKGKAVIIAKTREFNKEDVTNIESFIEANTKSAILQLKELA